MFFFIFFILKNKKQFFFFVLKKSYEIEPFIPIMPLRREDFDSEVLILVGRLSKYAYIESKYKNDNTL